MAVNLHVRGHRNLFNDPNTSFLNISLKQTYIEEIRSREGLVDPVDLSYPIAPKLDICMPFPSQILENVSHCMIHIWDEFTSVLGYRPPYFAMAHLVTRLVAIARALHNHQLDGGDDMSVEYSFSVDMEIFFVREIQIVRDEIINDEGVNNSPAGTSTARIEKLKSERFIGSTENKELGSCCICLEDMCGGKLLVGLPCKHVFHENCILQWLHKASCCPLCRAPLED